MTLSTLNSHHIYPQMYVTLSSSNSCCAIIIIMYFHHLDHHIHKNIHIHVARFGRPLNLDLNHWGLQDDHRLALLAHLPPDADAAARYMSLKDNQPKTTLWEKKWYLWKCRGDGSGSQPLRHLRDLPGATTAADDHFFSAAGLWPVVMLTNVLCLVLHVLKMSAALKPVT